MKKYVLILAAIIVLGACQRNKLKTDEKALAKQILIEEEQRAHVAELRAEREKQLADSLAKLPKGFRFPEIRTAEPANPFVSINIIGNRSNPQNIKLSQLFSRIEYIRLDQLPDTTVFHMVNGYIVAPDHIYLTTRTGNIFQFDRTGRYIRPICTGNLQFTKTNGGMMVPNVSAKMFEGAKGAYWNGHSLFYQYENLPAGKSYMVAFNDQEMFTGAGIQLPGSAEKKNLINGAGTILSEFNKDPSVFSQPTAYLIGNNTIAFTQRGKSVERKTDFVSVVSTTGDTLCKFKDHDPIINFTKSAFRGADNGDAYYLNGVLHLRQAFNDTVYQMVPPNRLVPKYILDFGEEGIKSAMEGIDPGVSLHDKLVPHAYLESGRFLFITYTKDYDCPNTAKSGSLKYSRLIYDKQKRTITTIYIDELAFLPEGSGTWPQAPEKNIENDLDGLPFKWPTMVTAEGLPCSVYQGKEFLNLKDTKAPVSNTNIDDHIIAIYH
jgi:hypothetical protein